ncbi:MAG: undecaprenyl-diphosphate phosphatase [bacterium]|nr:undecaprenyl-diphosphate phosphatase [bacterium]
MLLLPIIFLSFIQGLTEFLPISSSGHLVLIPHLLGWEDQGLLLDVAMHVGTLLAVVAYFWRDIKDMFFALPSLLKGDFSSQETNRILQLCLGTLPAVALGLLITTLDLKTRSVTMIACNLIIFGLLLKWADWKGEQTRTIREMTYKKAFLVGCAQSITLFPGVSRAGICLTATRFFGFKRHDAAKFTFLLSIPAITAAATNTGYKAFKAGELAGHLGDVFLFIFFSFLFGLGAIAFMMRWLQKSNVNVFVIYRLALGIFLLGYFW